MICVSASIAASTLLLAGFPSSATADNYDLSQDSYLDIPIQETGIVDVVLDGDTFRFIEEGATDSVNDSSFLDWDVEVAVLGQVKVVSGCT